MPNCRGLPNVLFAFAAQLALTLTSVVAPANGQEERLQPSGAPSRIDIFSVKIKESHLRGAANKELPRFGFEFAPVPIEKERFQELIDIANSNASGRHKSGAFAREAIYEGKLVGDALEGTARLELHTDDAKSPFFSLKGLRIALQEASGQPAAFWKDGSRAKLGLASNGEMVVKVDGPGPLTLRWALKGERDPSGKISFDFGVARANATTISLRLPETLRVVANSETVITTAQPEAGTRHWQLMLGGRSRAEISVMPPRLKSQSQGAIIVGENAEYLIDASGLHVVSRLELQVRGKGTFVESMKLRIPPGIRLLTAKLNGKQIDWSQADGSDGSQVELRLNQEFAPLLRHSLELSAVGKTALESELLLPRFIPENTVWQYGSAQLNFGGRVQLQDLDVRGGAIDGVHRPEADERSQSTRVRYHDPSGAISVRIAQRETSLLVEPTYAWRLEADGAKGRLAARITCEGEGINVIRAKLAAGWTIEERDIEVERAANINGESKDRTVRLTPSYGTAAQVDRDVEIALDPPLMPRETIRLLVRAKSDLSFSNQTLKVPQIEFLKFARAKSGLFVGALTTSAPQTVRVRGDTQLAFLPLANLDPATALWLSPKSSVAVFSTSGATSSVALNLAPGARRLTASIDVVARADANGMKESYTIRCIPDSAGVDRLRVHFWPPSDVPLQWQFSTDGPEPVARVTRVANDDADESKRAEIWDVVFPTRQVGSIQMTAERYTNVSGSAPMHVSLAAVDGATTQSGRCTIASQQHVPLELETNGMQPIAAVSELVDSDVWGSFRFTPSARQADLSTNVQITRRNGAGSQARAWNLLIESKVSHSGSAVHRATWLVHVDGRTNLNVQLPPGAQLRSASVSGVLADPAISEDRKFSVELPADDDTVRLVVDYSTNAAGLSAWHTLSPAIPEVDIPVLHHRWRVTLPQGYAPYRGGMFRTRPRASGSLRAELSGLFGSRTEIDHESRELAIAGRAVDELHVNDSQRRSVDMLARRLTEEGGTWGQALLRYQFTPANQEEFVAALLLMDKRALSRSGLSAESVLATVEGDSLSQRLGRVLSENGLVVVATGKYLLLTDEEFVQTHAANLLRGRPENLVFVRRGLGDRLLSAESLTAEWVTTPQIWASPLAQEPPPWSAATGELVPQEGAGTVHDVPMGPDGTARVAIYSIATFRAFGLAALLGGFAIALWVRTVPKTYWASVALLGGGISMLLVQPWAAIVAGGVLGVALSLLCQYCLFPRLRRRERRPTEVAAGGSFPLAGRTTMFIVAAAALGLALSRSFAAEGDDVSVYPVWFRLDDEGKETGKVDLPKELLAELHRREAAAKSPQVDWVITDALYTAQLGWHATEEKLDVQFVEVEYSIDVSNRGQQVLLSLPRKGLTLTDAGVELDGEPVQARWNEQHLAVRLPPRALGEHRLRFKLRASVADDDGVESVRFAIPTIPQARLRVYAPEDAPVIEATQAIGRITKRTTAGSERGEDGRAATPKLEAFIGPVDALHLTWRRGALASEEKHRFSTEELYWLSHDERGARLDVQLRLRGKLRGFADGRIVVTTDSNDLQPTGATEADSNEGTPTSNQRRFRLPASPTGENLLTARGVFRLENAADVGRLVLPELSIPGATQRRRWFAVSLPKGFAIASPRGLSPQPPKTFLQSWGEKENKPDQVFSWPLRKNTVAHFRLAPKSEKAKVRQLVRYRFAEDHIRVAFHATLLSADSVKSALQQTINVPNQFRVARVAIESTQSDQATPADTIAWWSHHNNGVHVFFEREWAAHDELVVEGIVPLAGRTDLNLPSFALAEAEVISSHFEIFRGSDVLLDVRTEAPASRKETAAAWDPKWGRLTHAFQIEGSQALPAQVRIEPNQPEVKAIQIARLTRSDAAWNMDVSYRMNVQQPPRNDLKSVVDQIEFLLPAELAPKLILEPQMLQYFLPSQDATQKRLLLVANEPIGGEFSLRMTFHDVVPPGRRVQPFDIRPLAKNTQQFVAVPRAIESQSVVWDKVNVQQVGAIEGLEDADQNLRSHVIFRVLEEPHAVALRSLRRTTDVPLVRLADIRFAWDGHERCTGLATFDLEPESKSACEIQVPSQARIVDVRVDGLPVTTQRMSAHRWRIPFAGHNLPQRLEVLYQGECLADRGRITAYAPQLSGITIERTAWSIWAPHGAGRPTSPDRGAPTAVELDVLRLRSLTELIRIPTHLRLEHSTDELQDWLAPWRQRWNAGLQHVIRSDRLVDALVGGGHKPADVSGLSYTFEETLREFQIADAQNGAKADEELLRRLWQAALPSDMRVTLRTHKGASQEQDISYVRDIHEGWSGRTAFAGVLILAAGSVFLLRRWAAASDWLVQCRHAVGIGVGICWALFLWPAMFGWVIAVVCAILLAWPSGLLSPLSKRDELILRSSSQPPE